MIGRKSLNCLYLHGLVLTSDKGGACREELLQAKLKEKEKDKGKEKKDKKDKKVSILHFHKA